MLTDALLQLSDAQAVTASAVSTKSIDLSEVRDIGAGNDLYLMITVDETVTAAGAATVTFQVVSDDNAALSSPTVLIQSDAIGKAELPAARKPILIPIPESFLEANPIGEQYLGVNYSIGTGPLTAGQFSAVITDSKVSVDKHYPSGFSVL